MYKVWTKEIKILCFWKCQTRSYASQVLRYLPQISPYLGDIVYPCYLFYILPFNNYHKRALYIDDSNLSKNCKLLRKLLINLDLVSSNIYLKDKVVLLSYVVMYMAYPRNLMQFSKPKWHHFWIKDEIVI